MKSLSPILSNELISNALKIPKEQNLAEASSVALGAIAMQGVRRSNPNLGEVFVVFGLGILGQITVQLLRNNGCTVIGIDIEDQKGQIAMNNGMNHFINGSNVDVADQVKRFSNGVGADSVIITAASSSNQIVSDAFKNWRGMSESGGRRIKRSISLDMNSVKFCDKRLLEKLKKIDLLKDYFDEKTIEIKEFNSGKDTAHSANIRQLTNLGSFRAYLEKYLSMNKQISKEMTFLVRQLAPNEKGLPIEIYVFSSEQRWAHYEAIQGDIFDHIIAILPEFELNVFQVPSGNDFKKLSDN